MLRSCWLSADFWSTTSPSGGGFSATPRNWSDVCARDLNRPTTVGAWTLTYIRVKGKWRYLYRALDSSGATLDFLLFSQAGCGRSKALPEPKPWDSRTIPCRVSSTPTV